jgi:hypothetical protein
MKENLGEEEHPQLICRIESQETAKVALNDMIIGPYHEITRTNLGDKFFSKVIV